MVDYSEDAVRDWLNQIDENEFLERVRIKRDEMNFHRWEKIWISILRSQKVKKVTVAFKFNLGGLYITSRTTKTWYYGG